MFILVFLTIFTFSILIGLIIEATPSINNTFIMLLPITLPSTISVLLEPSALIDTANSGADVPNATIVKPINIFDTLKFCAVDDAPSTNISAPLINNTNPTINNNILIIIFLFSYHNIIAHNFLLM